MFGANLRNYSYLVISGGLFCFLSKYKVCFSDYCLIASLLGSSRNHVLDRINSIASLSYCSNSKPHRLKLTKLQMLESKVKFAYISNNQ